MTHRDNDNLSYPSPSSIVPPPPSGGIKVTAAQQIRITALELSVNSYYMQDGSIEQIFTRAKNFEAYIRNGDCVYLTKE